MKSTPILRAGMVGLGMIFEETYRPFFERARRAGLFQREFGLVEVPLTAVASRTGARATRLLQEAGESMGPCASFAGADSVARLVASDVDVVCIATPDDRHFQSARLALEAGKHVLIEKPSVLSLQELELLVEIARRKQVLAKVVYHKLADPDHKKLRTHVADGVLRHVNSGYCTLLEPKQISGSQFAEWIVGRNPGTYVAVHYIKLIDFSFGQMQNSNVAWTSVHASAPGDQKTQKVITPWKLARVSATGQRGLVGPPDGPTWDSVQLRIVYAYADGREAAFDIHTSWVAPDNFPGYVDQEVQFRFDNGVWNAHQRKRGVELTVEGRTPGDLKITPNHHYNGSFLEPWDERSQRGYGIEIIERFFREAAFVEFGGPAEQRGERLERMRSLSYNDLAADRHTVAIVQAMEMILREHAEGRPGCVVEFNRPEGGLVLCRPGDASIRVLYEAPV